MKGLETEREGGKKRIESVREERAERIFESQGWRKEERRKRQKENRMERDGQKGHDKGIKRPSIRR